MVVLQSPRFRALKGNPTAGFYLPGEVFRKRGVLNRPAAVIVGAERSRLVRAEPSFPLEGRLRAGSGQHKVSETLDINAPDCGELGEILKFCTDC